ncbi:MAG: HEPN domain-containing protein [Sporocytophaga sp.]|uniref:HEPN domain-containing protein n=1 Tax=Sporocytophaga sp. TaxID=2231183 RepID=UPI001B220874|nr:HEPN domain-containing protein [Sporocytophaga sp.]MBO9703691.1 HEPN domain-containing protein [Sporocytophaga sp.]
MKTSIDFLPAHKQGELISVRDLIVEAFEPEMIILFGSYARNEWVEDRYVEDGITYEYKSDFDILVISRVELGPRRSNRWYKTEESVKKLPLQTPVSLIHHGIKFVNKEIRKNSYFFTDILKEGVLLYDTQNFQLAEPGVLNEQQLKKQAKEDFEQWFGSANVFLKTYFFNLNENDLKIAAFQLHQATERYYTALLLVYTGYRPKTHDIQKLGEMAAQINERFKTVFPFADPESKARFELLKRAYIDARYQKTYTIGNEDLEYLAKRVEVLRDLVKEVCEERGR